MLQQGRAVAARRGHKPDVGLAACESEIVAERDLIARVRLSAPQARSAATSRRELALSVRQTIVDFLGAGPAQPGT